MSTSNIFEMCRRIAGKQLIVCDNSEPRLISELKTKGLEYNANDKEEGQYIDRNRPNARLRHCSGQRIYQYNYGVQ